MIYVYVLKSTRHWRFYVGMSKDVSKRLYEHNCGYTKSTKPYRPWELVCTIPVDSYEEARRIEKKLKSGAGKELIKRFWEGKRNGDDHPLLPS
jgi:putative endonuclease